jgi:hypothetical protein
MAVAQLVWRVCSVWMGFLAVSTGTLKMGSGLIPFDRIRGKC